MDTATTIYIIAGVVLAGFIVLVLLKGVIKTLLFGLGLLGAGFAYYWMSRHGFSYLSFITKDPKAWMTTALAWISALVVLAVFIHGMTWFGSVFSWSNSGGGRAKGILTSILMSIVVVWLALIAVFYYGSLAEVKRAHEIALSQIDPEHKVSSPFVYEWSSKIKESDSSRWLLKLAPMEDPELVSLAKLVAYLATFEPQAAVRRFTVIAERDQIPRSRRLWTLSQDVAIRNLVERNDIAALLNHTELNKFLNDASSREAIRRFPVDQYIGKASR